MPCPYSGLSTFTIILVLYVYSLSSANVLNGYSNPETSEDDITSHVTGTRWRRSFSGIGRTIVNYFLKGSVIEVPTRNSYRRIFLKEGSMNDAIKDFNSFNAHVKSSHGTDMKDINIDIIKSKNVFRVTRVAGKTKYKLKISNAEVQGRPLITISDPYMLVQIVYVKRF